MKRTRSRPTGRYVFFAFLVLVIPYFAANFIHAAYPLGKLISIGVPLCTMMAYFLIYGLHPKTVIIKSGSKLDRLHTQRTRRVIELIARALIVFTGLGLMLTVVIPFCRDAYDVIQGRLPAMERDTVTESTIPYGGLLFLYQSIRVNSHATNAERIYRVYTIPLLKTERTYYLCVLRRSRFIVKAIPAEQREKGEGEEDGTGVRSEE